MSVSATLPSMKSSSELPAITDPGHPDSLNRRPEKLKLLAVCNIDGMAWAILRQWLTGLLEIGYEVHIACAPGEYSSRLADMGFYMHPIAMQRTFRPWAYIRPLFQLWNLIRRGGFVAVNTHSAVGGAVGRVAAWLAGCKTVVYTVHGFYFHDNMPIVPRSLMIAMEWLLGRNTQGFMFVSAEDSRTAIRIGIVPKSARYMTIFNGVDLNVFTPSSARPEAALSFKRELGIDVDTPVVGIVGRIVREKGYREFLEMACYVSKKRKTAFLVVGDTLPSDRDPFGPVFREDVAKAGLASSFFFTGLTDRVPDYLGIMDIFVLPSYREGFPRSIIEAMSVGLPVIATDIRGCREAVVHGETGLIIPPGNGGALADAADRLLTNPEEARAMGRAGRARAVRLYDYVAVQRNFVCFIDEIVNKRLQTVSDGEIV
jgi:glycosyltransferase involved in cell wall biosynthesis